MKSQRPTPERLKELKNSIEQRGGIFTELLTEIDILNDENDSLVKERNDLKYVLNEINKNVIPGEVDSIEGLKLLVNERDRYKSRMQAAQDAFMEQHKNAVEWSKYGINLLKIIKEINQWCEDNESKHLCYQAMRLPQPGEPSDLKGDGK